MVEIPKQTAKIIAARPNILWVITSIDFFMVFNFIGKLKNYKTVI
jgi:hypothetical protein